MVKSSTLLKKYIISYLLIDNQYVIMTANVSEKNNGRGIRFRHFPAANRLLYQLNSRTIIILVFLLAINYKTNFLQNRKNDGIMITLATEY